MRPLPVLIVDDEVGFVEVVCKCLRRRRIMATGVPSGQQTMQVLRTQD